MNLKKAIAVHQERRAKYAPDFTFHDEVSSILADAFIATFAQTDREEEPSEEWLKSHGFEQDDECGAWCDRDESFPLFIKRSDSYPRVWCAEIDGTSWPVDIHVRGQIYDLCFTLERPLTVAK